MVIFAGSDQGERGGSCENTEIACFWFETTELPPELFISLIILLDEVMGVLLESNELSKNCSVQVVLGWLLSNSFFPIFFFPQSYLNTVKVLKILIC